MFDRIFCVNEIFLEKLVFIQDSVFSVPCSGRNSSRIKYYKCWQ